MRQGAYGLKIRDDLVVSNETQEPAEKARSVMLALIRANSTELLEKEATCCNLATD